MKLVVFLLGLLICNVCLPQAQDYVLGEGKYYSESEDEALIKRELLYEAFRDVYTKEMASLGLSSELFWKKFDEKLKKSFMAQYPALTDMQTDEAKKNLETLKKAQLDFNQFISGYTIKRMTRSTHDPKLRYIHIEAKTNREEIRHIYYSYLGDVKTGKLTKLLFKPEIVLKGLSAEDLGVKREKDLLEALNKSWMDFLAKNKPDAIAEVVLFSDKLEDDLKKWQGLKPEKIEDDGPKSLEDVQFFNLVLEIKPKRLKTEFLDYGYEVNSSYYVKDMNTGEVLTHGEIPMEEKHFHSLKTAELASAVASFLYRIPLNAMLSLKTEVRSSMAHNPHTSPLKVVGFKTLEDVMAFSDSLESKGSRYNLKSHLLSFENEVADFKLILDGNDKELKEVLNLIKQEKKNFVPELIDSDGMLSVKLSYPENVQGVTPRTENKSL